MPTNRPGASGRLGHRVLGDRRWGLIRNAGPLHGHWISELTVYPPGITTGERWAVGADRFAPVGGAVLGLLLTAASYRLLPVWATLILLLAPPALLAAVVRRLTRRIRRQLRSVVVTRDYRSEPPTITGDAALLQACCAELTALDGDSDRISVVEYERRWGEVYHRLPRSGPTRDASRVAAGP